MASKREINPSESVTIDGPFKRIVGEAGQRIREARLRKDMVQDALAKLLNVSRGAVTQWEVGATFPNYEKMMELAAVLDVSPAWVAFGIDATRGNTIAQGEDVFGIDIIEFGDGPNHRRTVGQHCLSARYLTAKKIQFESGQPPQIFFVQVETLDFSPRIPENSYVLVDPRTPHVGSSGDFLIWNGSAAQVVHLEPSLAEPGSVVIHTSQRDIDNRFNPQLVAVPKLGVIGKVRGMLS